MNRGRPTIDQAVAAAGFGRLEGTFTSLRRVPMRAAWIAMICAAALATVLALLHVYLVATLIVPSVLVVLAIVRYRFEPVTGRRWLMLYERGMVEVVPATGARLVRYGDVTDVVPDPARPSEFVVRLAAPDQAAPTLSLADLTPATQLRATLARRLPSVPWRANQGNVPVRSALTGIGFAALAILPALVPVSRAMAPSAVAETARPARPGTPTVRPTGSIATTAPGPAVVPSSPGTPPAPSAPTSTTPPVRALPMPTITEMIDSKG